MAHWNDVFTFCTFSLYLCFLIYNKKKKKSLWLTLFLKKKKIANLPVNTRTQLSFMLSHIITHLCLSLSRYFPKSPQITHTMCHKAWQNQRCDISRLLWGSEREKEESCGGRSVKEECSIMYCGFVQVTVGSNAVVTHLKLALACPQRRTEALQTLANPYSPDTCSAWRILRYWPSIQLAFRVDEKR